MNSEENFTNIYINNLDNSVNEASLRQICEGICGVGTVKTLVIFKARNEHSMGYGFCNFINHQCALKAIKYMNSMIIGSKKISAARATPKNDRDQYKRSLSQLSQAPELNANVYIKNFDSFVNEEFLRNAFSRFGPIINVRIMRNLNGFSKGFGFVSYTKHEDALAAIKEMNGTSLAGRTITVDFYTPKNSRKPSDSPKATATAAAAPVITTVSSEESSPDLTAVVPVQRPTAAVFSDMEEGDNDPQEVLSEPSEDDDDDNDDDKEKAEGEEVNEERFKSLLQKQPQQSQLSLKLQPVLDQIPFTPYIPMPEPAVAVAVAMATVPKRPSASFRATEPRAFAIVVHNLKYVFDEKEVRKIFYDFKDFDVKQLLSERGLPTGDWKVTFQTKRDMERALSICDTLIVRGQRVYANQYKKLRLRKRTASASVTAAAAATAAAMADSLKTSYSSPSTPRFMPRSHQPANLPAAAAAAAASERVPSFNGFACFAGMGGDDENYSLCGGNDVEEDDGCRKRSLSLNDSGVSAQAGLRSGLAIPQNNFHFGFQECACDNDSSAVNPLFVGLNNCGCCGSSDFGAGFNNKGSEFLFFNAFDKNNSPMSGQNYGF